MITLITKIGEIWRLLNEQVEYVVLEECQSCYYILIRTLIPLRKHFLLQNDHILTIEKNISMIFVESNRGFLDPAWEEDLFKKKTLKNGVYILPEIERKYVEIYDSYCHTNVFRYRNKEFINDRYGNSMFYSTKQWIDQLEEYMNLYGYHYYFCNLKFIGINELLISKYHFIQKKDRRLLLFHVIKKKNPGLLCKIRFFFLKKYNSCLWLFRKQRIQKILDGNISFQEVDKNSIKFGCKYYKIVKDSQNYGFLKGYDHYCIADQEIQANQLLYHEENGYYLKLLYSEKGKFTIFEFLNDETLEDILLKRSLTKEEIIVLIRSMNEILSDLEKFKIIHRDIAPKNIILKYQNGKLIGIRIIDFGYAVIQQQEYLNIHNIFDWKVLRSLGDTFKPDLYCWDDAVATLNMLEKVDPNIYQNYQAELQPIIQRKWKLTIEGEGRDENCFFDFTL